MYIFEEAVSADNQHRSGSLETYTAFDADNRIAHVHITSDTVCGTDLFYLLDRLDRIIECFVIDSFQFSLFESETELFAAFFSTCFR